MSCLRLPATASTWNPCRCNAATHYRCRISSSGQKRGLNNFDRVSLEGSFYNDGSIHIPHPYRGPKNSSCGQVKHVFLHGSSAWKTTKTSKSQSSAELVAGLGFRALWKARSMMLWASRLHEISVEPLLL